MLPSFARRTAAGAAALMLVGAEALEACRPPPISFADNWTYVVDDHCALPPLDQAELNATVMIRAKAPGLTIMHRYGVHRLTFPEENVTLALAPPSSAAPHAVVRGHAALMDIRPRIYTERCFRRIIARLYRAGVLDASKDVVDSGGWKGERYYLVVVRVRGASQVGH